jgi:hypothetical protein
MTSYKEEIKKIKKVFKDKNKDTIRYYDLEHIENYHEALKEMEEKHMVNTYFIGYNVYIERIW